MDPLSYHVKKLDLEDGRVDGKLTRENLLASMDENGDQQLSQSEIETYLSQDTTLAVKLGKASPIVRIFQDVVNYNQDFVYVEAIKLFKSELASGQADSALRRFVELNTSEPTTAKKWLASLTLDERLALLRATTLPGAKLTQSARDALWSVDDPALQGAITAKLMHMGSLPADVTLLMQVIEKAPPAKRDQLIDTAMAGPSWEPFTRTKPAPPLKEPFATNLPNFAGQLQLFKALSQHDNVALRAGALRHAPHLQKQALGSTSPFKNDPSGLGEARTSVANMDPDFKRTVDAEYARRKEVLKAYYNGFPDPWPAKQAASMQIATAKALMKDVRAMLQFMKQGDTAGPDALSFEHFNQAAVSLLSPPNEKALAVVKDGMKQLLAKASDPKASPAERKSAAFALGRLVAALKNAAYDVDKEKEKSRDALLKLLEGVLNEIPGGGYLATYIDPKITDQQEKFEALRMQFIERLDAADNGEHDFSDQFQRGYLMRKEEAH